MNKKKNYKKGTRLEIIKTLHMSAVIPSKGLVIMNTPRTYKDKLHEMIEEGVIEENRVKNEGRMYRIFTLKDYEKNRNKYIDNLPDGYYEKYVMGNQILARQCKNKPGIVSLRIITNAETYMIMKQAGVKCDPDTRSNLYSSKEISSNDNMYFTSREIKGYTEYNDNVKIETKEKSGIKGNIKSVIASRITGLLISTGGIYAVYHFGRSITNWQNTGEQKIKVYINGILGKRIPYAEPCNSSLILIEDYTTLSDVIAPQTTNKKKETYYDNLKSTYRFGYVLPYSLDGRRMLEIMTTKEWGQKIKDIILERFERNDTEKTGYPIDAYKDGKEVYLFCIPDLNRFQRFVNYEKMNFTGEKRSIVVCFDFQKEMVAKTCGLICQIIVVKFDVFYRMYKQMEEDKWE